MSPASGFKDPTIKPVRFWRQANQGFYARFRRWLRQGGYGKSAMTQYGVAARLTLGWLDTPYWLIDPINDLDHVRDYIRSNYDSSGTQKSYFKGVAKLEEFLRHTCHTPAPPKQVNWAYFTGPLPGWLVDDIRAYVAHRSRAWLPGEYYQCAGGLLGPLTRFLRWLAAHCPLTSIADITPEFWFEYLDFRLAAGIDSRTINSTQGILMSFLQFLSDLDRPICQRMLSVQYLKVGPHIPRDVPVSQLVRLMQEIETDAASDHKGVCRMGLMDRAWFHLMLYSGLRSCEIRRLLLPDIDFEGRRIMIKQSKGLKDRIVFLSAPTIVAIQAFLPVRGPMTTDHAFSLRHKPLTVTYFAQRLRTYAGRCGIHVSPHQLRHSCATLLLNAGAPILTVQHLLGHKYIDTTLEYARLYDGTVAADYYRAMNEVEHRLSLGENPIQPTIDKGHLIALVDLLGSGTLNGKQREIIRALRDGILALVPLEKKAVDKTVLNC